MGSHPNCRGGQAKIFDECSDQIDLFYTAKKRADTEGKVLLVSYGAEWCIWCHVFDAYVRGGVENFTYTYGDEGADERWTETLHERAEYDISKHAYTLAKFVSESFVIVHIDYEHSPNGDDVLSQSGAWENYTENIPFIYTVDRNGNFAAALNHDDAEVRRDTDDWYRGYDRLKLLNQLEGMRSAALP